MQKAVEIDPQNAGFQNDLGVALNGVKNFEAAEEVLKRALELGDNDFYLPYRHLAVSLMGQGKLDGALKAVNFSIDFTERANDADIQQRARATKVEIMEAREAQQTPPAPGV